MQLGRKVSAVRIDGNRQHLRKKSPTRIARSERKAKGCSSAPELCVQIRQSHEVGTGAGRRGGRSGTPSSPRLLKKPVCAHGPAQQKGRGPRDSPRPVSSAHPSPAGGGGMNGGRAGRCPSSPPPLPAPSPYLFSPPPPPRGSRSSGWSGAGCGAGTGRTMRCGALALALLCALPLGAVELELPETGSGLQAGRRETSLKGGDGMRCGGLGETPLESLTGGRDARGGGVR